jgi:hypothetical protein
VEEQEDQVQDREVETQETIPQATTMIAGDHQRVLIHISSHLLAASGQLEIRGLQAPTVVEAIILKESKVTNAMKRLE